MLSDVNDTKLSQLQSALRDIRRVANWGAIEFSEAAGISRYTLYRIETGRQKLTKLQYRAIRNVIDTADTNTRNKIRYIEKSNRIQKEDN